MEWSVGLDVLYIESVLNCVSVFGILVGIILYRNLVILNKDVDGLKIVNLIKIIVVFWLI